MSGYTHTRGPWAVLIPHKSAESKYPSVVSPAGDAEIGTWMVAERVRWMEDACLIAAAPTMYEFIEKKAHEGDADAKRIIASVHGKS